MSTIRFNVTGERQLQAKLSRLSDQLRGRALGDAVMVGGEVIVNEATLPGHVPVDTGNLRASVFVEEAKLTVTGASTRVGPSKNAPYGIYVEYGTSRMRAQPYMRPAADTRKRDVAGVIRESLERAVRAAL